MKEHTTAIPTAFLSYLVHKLALYSERGSQEWALALNGSTDELLTYYKGEFERLREKAVQP